MKLTNIKGKISNSIFNSVHNKSHAKTDISFDIWFKTHNEIRIPNEESIQDMQIKTLDNLQNEIN